MDSLTASSVLVSALDLGGDGPAVVIKDCIDVAGAPTRYGSRIFAEAEAASRNAAIVDRLLATGAHIVGKANMHEFAYGVSGVNLWTGTPLNPRYPGRIPGGSSSGSAVAVAAGMADIGIGTDTGGSIRVPAACCGIYGLKPTFGRISRVGVSPLRSSLDCVGPMARDLPGVVDAMARLDPSFAPSTDVSAFRIGICRCEAPAADAVSRRVMGTSLDVVTVDLQHLDAAHYAGLRIIASETWAAFGQHVDDDRIGLDVGERLRNASRVGAADLADAEMTRAVFTAEVDAVLRDVDAIVTPTLPDAAPALEHAGDPDIVSITKLVRPFNVSGHPALNLPFEMDGAPIGLQIVGAKGREERLLAIAAILDDVL